jgi:hypothetical protein
LSRQFRIRHQEPAKSQSKNYRFASGLAAYSFFWDKTIDAAPASFYTSYLTLGNNLSYQ